jgi:predicted O-linked N-acetylglucosamine transferase (SPINDLY family)
MTIQQAFDLAVQHHQAGRLNEAESLYRQILAVEPRHAESLHHLGVLARQMGRSDIAVDLIRQAIVIDPLNPDAHYNLGTALGDLGQLDHAIAAYRQAIALQPAFSAAFNNLGLALCKQGQRDEAATAYAQAILLQPDFAAAYYNWGIALSEKGQFDEAIAKYRPAIALQPDYPEAYNNLGITLKDKGLLDEALVACRTAITLQPNLAEAHSNLGTILLETGQPHAALAAFRQAITLQPELVRAHSNLLSCLNYAPDLEPSALAEEHRRWARQHGEPLQRFIQPHPNDRSPERRLRIGYVSPDFRDHSVAYFFEGLLARHDSAQVEVFCYAELMKSDAVTARIERLAEHWRKITGMPDAEVAELIRRDGIDILVDLAGHTGNSRLLVFARKPAPVQATWLGYSNKTWLGTMDYRLTDAIADPLGSSDEPDGERLIRLPKTFACFRPADAAPPVAPPPALSRGGVTFASFHMLAKLNDELLGRWAEILNRVAASRLLLVVAGLDEVTTRERFIRFFGERGIGAERLDFKGRQTLEHYLALHHEVDVLLDCHPFSGHTVSCHALWMGVPVVTLTGKTHCSRMVASVLTNLGLPELVARTPEDYVRIAVELADDLPRLTELRATLRTRMERSRLMDAPAFARDIEATYRTMWRTWCEQPETPSCPK